MNVVRGLEICCRDSSNENRSIDWQENGREYRMDCKKNDVGRSIVVFARDVEGKRFKIFIPKGRV